MKKLSFVIPCYYSVSTIEVVVEDIIKTVKERPEFSYEIILVNDGSTDGTYDKIVKMAKENTIIKGVDFAKNFGQHSALMMGFRYATGDIIVSLDDDGQNPPCEVFKLIEKIDEGYDVVFGNYAEKKHSAFRNLGSIINSLMLRTLLGKPKDLSITSFFCCKRFIIDEITRYENSFPYIAGLLLRSTDKIANVDIEHKARVSGKSGYSIGKLLSLWINGFTAFSVIPLRVATLLGVLFACVGFLYGSFIVINKLFINPDAPLGYSSLMAVLVFIGGVLMLMLGMLGEYIGRIYISINNSPQSVVRSTINIGENDEKPVGSTSQQ